MKLRRHIAFFAVLAASMVMFVHAVVPHHHRASDLSICTEAPVPCRHTPAAQGHAVVLYDADCDCNCTGVQCAAPLPFTLRFGGDGDDPTSAMDSLLPLFICDHCTGHRSLSTVAGLFPGKGTTSYFIDDARLLAQWVPVSVPGRAPPVL